MKLRTLVDSKKALETLMKEPLPVSLAWELSKTLKTCTPELTAFEEIKNKLIIELGEPEIKEGSSTGNYLLKPDKMPDFSKRMEELLEKEIDFSVPTIKIKDLVDYKDANGKGISLSAADLLLLDWLIVE